MSVGHSAVDIPAPAPGVGTGSAAAEGGATPVCGALSVVLPSSYVLSTLASHFMLSHFAFVPVNTFLAHRYLWNVATHVLVEGSLPLTACNLAVVLTVGRRLERDAAALLQLLAVTAVATSFALFFAAPALSALFSAPYAAAAFCGFMPCSVALAVAAFQRSPESVVVAANDNAALRAAYLPLALFAFTCVVDIVAGPGVPEEEDINAGTTPLAGHTLPAFIAWHVAWFYLRFLKGGRGDPSAAMAYESMFPGPLRVLARAAAGVAFPLVRCCGLGGSATGAGPAHAAAAEHAPLVRSEDGATVDLPGSDPSTADRRRQVALAALAERLQKAREHQHKAKAGPATAPSAGVADPAPPAAETGAADPAVDAGQSPQVAAVAGRKTQSDAVEF